MKPEVLLQLIHDLQVQINQLRQANSVLQQQLAVAQEKAAQAPRVEGVHVNGVGY